MTDHITDGFLHAVEQDFLAQSLAVDHTHRLEDETRFETMFCPRPLVLRHKARDRQRVVLGLGEVDDLTVGMGLKRGKCRQEVNGFKDTGLALRVGTHQQDHPLRDVHIQAGEVAKVGQGEVFEVHMDLWRCEEIASRLTLTMPSLIQSHRAMGYCYIQPAEYLA